MSGHTSIVTALRELTAGRMICVVDDIDRENEADLVVAAEFVTSAQMAFMVRHTTGIVCAAMSEARSSELNLPPMVANNADPHGTAFTVSVDLNVTGTGVSAADRTATVRALAASGTAPTDFRRPGHIFPLRARNGGVLERPGHTEAAVDLTSMAGLSGVGVISELISDDGSMMRRDGLIRFAAEHGLAIVTIDDLIAHRAEVADVELVASANMPTVFGDFTVAAFRAQSDGAEHLAFFVGDLVAASGDLGVLTRVHSECLTGDILGSMRCDCGSQLEQSLQAIAAEGTGVVVYLRGHEGRGIGLARKIAAYSLQDEGLDTVDANLAQGLPTDSRSYRIGAQILDLLHVKRIRLITNNPSKISMLRDCGVDVLNRVEIPPLENSHNSRYLRTKRDRMGHFLPA